MANDEQELARKFGLLCKMTDEHVKNMTVQQQDRQRQVYLAQARGPVRNGDFLAQMTDLIAMFRAAQFKPDGSK